jgi:pimeloyl-ACP methyl ester carboxylesterase
MPSVISNRTSLYYEERGHGFAVVLLHGFTTSLVGNWQRRGWLDLLSGSGFRVIALDFPSHGRSADVTEDARCSTATLASDVLALLDHLAIPEAPLIGFSMGGGVALRVALDCPSRVAKLVIAGVGDNALNQHHDPSEIETVVRAFEAEKVDLIESPQAHRLRRNADLAGHDARALLPYLRHGGWPGGLSETRPIQIPVLLIVATGDQYMRETRALRTWLDHATVIEVAGRDHHDVLDDERVKRTVVAFLRTKEPTPSSDAR